MTNILVIDDDQMSRHLLKAILEKAGYRVLYAGGGDEGLHLFHTNPIDLVITDILMPGTDGLAVIRTLLNTAPDVKIIALSGGGMILTAETSLNIARKMGAFESLAKPFVPTELLAMIQRILHTTTHSSEAIIPQAALSAS